MNSCFEPLADKEYEAYVRGVASRDEVKTEGYTYTEDGGKQHKVEHRCEALFPRAILSVARLRAHGRDVDGYEDENYRKISPKNHIGRAMRHLFLWMCRDAEDGTPEEHLVHAACRILMALEILIIERDPMITDEWKKRWKDGEEE